MSAQTLRAQTQTLTDEVLDVLAGSEALTTREIYAQVTTASEMDQVSKTIYFLRKRGDVALAELDDAGQRRYRLAAQGEPEKAMPSPEGAAAVAPAATAGEQGAAGGGTATASPAAKARRGVKARGVRAEAAAKTEAAYLPVVAAPDRRWAVLQERRLALAERAMAVVEMILREEKSHGLA